uniref:Uncharacterized protein n=1 Tax=Zea mays TaxID=4577 RepID=C4IYM5_MAIZE|nr:unknown [Zea mays]
MPYTNCTIFGSSNDYRELRMETNSRNVMCMPFKCLNTAFRLVIPDLCSGVIRTSNQIGPVTTSEVVNTIDTLLMSIKCEVWIWRT